MNLIKRIESNLMRCLKLLNQLTGNLIKRIERYGSLGWALRQAGNLIKRIESDFDSSEFLEIEDAESHKEN